MFKDSPAHQLFTSNIYLLLIETQIRECSSIENNVRARLDRVITEKNRADKIQSHHSSHIVYSGHLQAAEAFKLFTGQKLFY